MQERSPTEFDPGRRHRPVSDTHDPLVGVASETEPDILGDGAIVNDRKTGGSCHASDNVDLTREGFHGIVIRLDDVQVCIQLCHLERIGLAVGVCDDFHIKRSEFRVKFLCPDT